jgi:CheY-like chemotaxis protein/glycine cleavage system H lipoate-binding protein
MSVETRVLVAEDEPDMLRGLERVLLYEGYDVEPARDGVEAAEKLKAGHFDVVVSDLRMPAVDGMDLLHMAQEKDRSVVFIMITGYGTVDNAVEAMKLGSFDYIPKPFPPSVLKEAIERGLDAKVHEPRPGAATATDRAGIQRHPSEHAWCRADPDGTVVVGADQEFFGAAGDVVFCDLPLQGDKLAEGQRCGRTIDSSGLIQKAFHCPLAGTVVAVNDKMLHEPWEAHRDPYGEGWLFRVAPSNREEEVKPLTPEKGP